MVFQSRRLYGARRNSHLSDEFFAIVRLVTIGLLIVMSATFFYRGFSFSRGVFILLWGTSIATITTGRFFIMEFEKLLYRRGKELKTVAIVGSNDAADEIFSVLTSHSSLGYEVVGYYADSPAVSTSKLSAAKYLGPIKELPNGITTYRLQAALIALSYKEHPQLLEMIRDAEGLNVELMMVPDMLDMMTSRVRIQDIEGIPFLKIKEIPLSTWNRISKRAFDVIFSSLILLLTLPFTLVLAAIIKLTSSGPIFFVQERISLDGKPFFVIKFRTMRTDAEVSTGPSPRKKRRRARDSNRKDSPPDKFGRASSIVECPDRTYEHRRPEARAAVLRRTIQRENPPLSRTPSRENRHDRVGASQRSSRRCTDR